MLDPLFQAAFVVLVLLAVFELGKKVGERRGAAIAAAAAAALQGATPKPPAPPAGAALPTLTDVLPLPNPPVAVGERFPYLGIELLCLGHYANTVGSPPGTIPGIRAEYVDRDGIIRQTFFRLDEIAALADEIRRGRTPSGVAA
jgi:hypothetical protein